jgi:Tol biopolymer transport system component
MGMAGIGAARGRPRFDRALAFAGVVCAFALASAGSSDGRSSGQPKDVKNGRIVAQLGDGVISLKPDGSGVRKLGLKHPPEYTPDGRHIVYSRWDSAREESDLFVAKPNGGNRRRLARGVAEDSVGAVSPDGKRVVFSSDGDLFTIRLDGKRRKRLTATSWFENDASYSPDGKLILFTRSDLADESLIEGDLFSVRPDGSGERRLTFEPNIDVAGEFSPNGREIVFQSDRNGGGGSDRTVYSGDSQNIWRMDRDGSDQRLLVGIVIPPLTPPPEGFVRVHEIGPTFSPDGRQIAFTVESYGRTAPGPPTAEVRVANADGSNVRTIFSAGETGRLNVVGWEPRGFVRR